MPQENSFIAFVSMLQKINSNWLWSQTGPTAECWDSAARKNSEAASIHPPPATHSTSIMWELAWAGGCCQNSPGPTEEAPCCSPESFLKVHAGFLSCCQSFTFSLARFLLLFGQSNAEALSCSFLPQCWVLSAATLPLTVANNNVLQLFRIRITWKKITHT